MGAVKHTPGPWVTRRAKAPDNTGGFDWAIAAGGKVIAEAFENVGYLTDGATYDGLPAEANANLIAAAPDLFAVVEEWLTIGNKLSERRTIRDKARAALAKARGAAK